MSKTLVAYFSASGSTAKLSKTLADAIGADLHEIRPVPVSYTHLLSETSFFSPGINNLILSIV